MSEIITCPSGLKGSTRAMLVREERILADRKLAKDGGQVDELLTACLEETLVAGPCEGVFQVGWRQHGGSDRGISVAEFPERQPQTTTSSSSISGNSVAGRSS